MGLIKWRGAIIALLCWANLLLSSSACAGTGGTFSLPLPNKKIKHKARLDLESNWVAGVGYRPVKVTIFNHPGVPTTFDRTFRVVLRPQGYGGGDFAGSVQDYVEMSEGSASGSTTISVPQSMQWASITIDVYEDGARIPELSEPISFMTNGRGWSGFATEGMPSVLFIDADVPPRDKRESLVITQRSGTPIEPTYLLPDIRQWQSLAPQPNYNGAQFNFPTFGKLGDKPADSFTLLNVADNERVELLPPDELPESWLNYTCLDIVFISLADAQAMAKAHPKRWQALLDWTASGSTLVVSGVGADLKQLAQVEKLCKIPAGINLEDDAKDHPGWTLPNPEYALQGLKVLYDQQAIIYGQRQYYNQDGTVRSADVPRIQNASTKSPQFAFRDLGLGRVAAMANDEALGDPPNEMSWLLNQIEARNWISYQRRGISLQRNNGDFMNFLVSGTGRVPVISFLVLISLFSVVIGPLNYIFLKRQRRLFFLLVTVPGGAAVVTASLFAYALISDGLGVRLRSRSFARLDQTTGQLSLWSRQSYYAGLAPSGGLAFPADTAVFPFQEFPSSNIAQRVLIWNEAQQQLRSGYLPSRTPAQFLVQRVVQSKAKLDVKPGTQSKPPQVTNQFGAKIERLVLRDRDGKYFHCGELAADGNVALSPVLPQDVQDSDDAGEREKKLHLEFLKIMQPFGYVYNETRPVPPDSYQMSEYSGNLWNFSDHGSRYNYYPQQYDRGLAPAIFATSILETELRRCTMPTLTLKPGTYLVMLDSNPEMPRGYANVQEQAGLHLIEGRW